MNNFFILGNPSNNLGDEAAMKGIVYGINKLMPDSEIYLSYAGQPDVSTIDDMITSYYHDEDFFTKEKLLFFALHLFCIKNNKLYYDFLNSDLIIIAPGGCGFHKWNYNKWIKLRVFLFICKLYKKQVMFHACSLGPFDQTHKRLIKSIINSATIVTLRDSTSYDHIMKLNLNLNKRIVVTSDSALMIPIKKNEKKKSKQKMVLGITPIDISFFNDDRINGLTPNLIHIFSHVINQLHREGRVQKVVFISHIPNSSAEDDVVNKIIERLNNNIVFTKEMHKNAEEALLAYKNIDLCIAARHHSGAFALKMGVPAVCIAYEHKAHGFFMQCDLDEYIIDMDKMTADQLLKKTIDLINNYDMVVNKIEQFMPCMEDTALNNTRIIKDFLHNGITEETI